MLAIYGNVLRAAGEGSLLEKALVHVLFFPPFITTTASVATQTIAEEEKERERAKQCR